MNGMRRFLALALALVMALGLTACSLDREDIEAAAQLVSEIADALDEPPAAPPSAPEANDGAESVFEASASGTTSTPEDDPPVDDAPVLDPEGWYTTKDDVALYLNTYGKLPGNFITKSEARALGWSGGGLDDYAPGKSIGGDTFGNYEGLLPEGSYHECDIDTMHASSRGAKRIVYSDDGRIYYTDDHYESFTLLYGEE